VIMPLLPMDYCTMNLLYPGLRHSLSPHLISLFERDFICLVYSWSNLIHVWFSNEVIMPSTEDYQNTGQKTESPEN
jgi:hypothetical protein